MVLLEAEKARVEAAKTAACEQLQAIYEKALKEVGETNAQIFEIHMMMLEDEDYNESIANIIETQKVNAEYAVAVTADNFAEMFSSMEDAYMQARATDVKDISNRIIANLTGNISGAAASEESMSICADDLARVKPFRWIKIKCWRLSPHTVLPTRTQQFLQET